MGSYTFKWEQPAEEVYVTGTFDNWAKTTKLDKKDAVHEKTVALPNASEKIYYKFIADGNWVNDHTAPTETNAEGIVNNVLLPENIKPPATPAHHLSTIAMAGKQPLENEKVASAMPGGFPETPAPNEGQAFFANPIPASEGAGNPISLAPGEKVPDPSAINTKTITSQVHDDPSLMASAKNSEQTFGVAPIPAMGGIGNPVSLAPGEKVPHPSTITGNTLNSNVKLDKESYEKSDSGAPVLPSALSPRSEAGAAGGSMFGLGPQTSNMIPESSLPMGGKAAMDQPDFGPTISSVAPGSTTQEMAGLVPKEPRGVPEVADKDSGPSGSSTKRSAGLAAGGITAAGAAAAGAAYFTNEKSKDHAFSLPPSVQQSISSMNAKGSSVPDTTAFTSVADPSLPQQVVAGEPPIVPSEQTLERNTENSVPSMVATSQKEMHHDPEASAFPEVVKAKSAVESEFMSEVNGSQATGGMAGSSTEQNAERATTGTLPNIVAASQREAEQAPEAAALPEMVKEKSAVESQLLSEVKESQATGLTAGSPTEQNAERATSGILPNVVSSSQRQAHADPEAAASPGMVKEKSAVESELMSEVKESQGSGEPAPTATAATTGTAPMAMAGASGLNASAASPAVPSKDHLAPPAAPEQPLDSRDVSPMSGARKPEVTTGVDSSKTAAASTPKKQRPASTLLKGTPDSQKTSTTEASGTGDKKSHRRSFFGKLKDKLKSLDMNPVLHPQRTFRERTQSMQAKSDTKRADEGVSNWITNLTPLPPPTLDGTTPDDISRNYPVTEPFPPFDPTTPPLNEPLPSNLRLTVPPIFINRPTKPCTHRTTLGLYQHGRRDSDPVLGHEISQAQYEYEQDIILPVRRNSQRSSASLRRTAAACGYSPPPASSKYSSSPDKASPVEPSHLVSSPEKSDNPVDSPNSPNSPTHRWGSLGDAIGVLPDASP